MNEVVVTDVKIRFWSMVVLMVKWALAAIPAVIILAVIWVAVTAALGMMFDGTFVWHWGQRQSM